MVSSQYILTVTILGLWQSRLPPAPLAGEVKKLTVTPYLTFVTQASKGLTAWAT